MVKTRINILIVEDDSTQGKALLEVFRRAGYSVTLCETSVQALNQSQRVEYHAMIVDCMLPKMNGVDLVEEVLAMLPHKPKVFMITGIYKDRKFIREAIGKTQAESFFIKPLNLEEVLAKVEASLSHLLEADAPPILSLYSNRVADAASLFELIEKEPTIHAFHLPKLYQRLQQAGVSGELGLISAVGEMSAVCFSEGKVFAVKTPDKESFFGSLAVSKGFVIPEDVLEALRDPRQKKLGEKLIDSMSLSPHAIDIILEEQLALRLSQTIQDDVVSLQWASKTFAVPEHTLAPERFESLLEDWLNSKVTADWIHSTLMVWGGFQLAGRYHAQLSGGHSIEALLKEPAFKTSNDLLALFRSLIHDDCYIGLRIVATQDFSFLESRLDRLILDYRHQNFFQFLGVGEKAHQREVSHAYDGYKDVFDPNRLPPNCPPEIIQKCTRVFKYIAKAYNTLSSDSDRQAYVADLQSKRAQEAMKAEPIFFAAISELQNGKAIPAAAKFQSLIDRKLEFKDLRAYRIWAGLKIDRNYNEIRLDQIPPEDRHSPAYLMAKGVQYHRAQHFKKALEAFRTAHILDPHLTIAKSELQRLAKDLERSGSQHKEMLREVTSVVSDFYGKTAKRRVS